MQYLKVIFLFCCVLIGANVRAQNEFMLYGNLKVDGDTIKGAKIIIRPFEERPEVQKIEDNTGQFRVFLKYGKEYIISFQKEGYVKLIFKVSTKLPSSMPQCCQTPLDLTCHLFKPGGKYDSLFLKPFITIKYETKLKSYNYGLDVDHYIKKLYERTEQERIAKAKEAARRKRIADSLAIEKHYLEHITKGNLYFDAKQYALAKNEYLEAHNVIPNRQYPLYKLEDVRTEVERIGQKNDSTKRVNADSIWKSQQKDTTKAKVVYRRMTAEEVRQKMIRDVHQNMKKMGADDQAIKESFDYLDKAVTQVRLMKGDSAVYPKLEPSRLDTAKTIAMPIPSLIISEPAENIVQSSADEPSVLQTNKADTKVLEMPYNEKKTVVYDQKRYQDSLSQKYPTLRTVEIQRDDYKTVTRVIVNKNNHVDIYAKVEHKWGATFYFIESGPQQYENISEAFYKVSTMDSTDVQYNK